MLTKSATIKDVPTPRFTLRRLLLLVTLCAVLSLVPTVAAQDALWVVGIAMAAFSLVLLLIAGVVLYAATMLAGLLIRRGRRE